MDTSTSAYRFLELVALSGEFPADNLYRIGIGENYGEKLVTKLKEDKRSKHTTTINCADTGLLQGGRKCCLPRILPGSPFI